MPASMMSAPTGSMPKVIGSSMVIVAMGPTPGSTPISVPIRQPRKHRPRFLMDSATPSPSARLLNRSNTCGPSACEQVLESSEEGADLAFPCSVCVVDEVGDDADGIEGDRQVEQLLEQEPCQRRHDDGEDDDLHRPAVPVGECRHDDRGRPR